jgi:hypothetical protein
MFKWELYEEYKRQADKAQELNRRYREKVEAAQADEKAALEAYEQLLQREFEGEDVTKEKKKAQAAIETARAALKVAQKEQAKAQEYAREALNGKITAKDLVFDWNGNIVPSLRKERLEPIKERMRSHLEGYYSALIDFYKLEDEFKGLEAELRELERCRLRKPREPMYVAKSVTELRDVPKPSDAHFEHIAKTKTLPKEL